MKVFNPQQARSKIERYCAYQERSHQEVRTKLYGFGLYRDDVEEILSSLITDGFLNEERFAKAYAGGKFRIKKWGRMKITRALEAKGVSPNCIRIGLREIDEQDYEIALRTLLEQKKESLDEENLFVLRDKVSSFAIRKGYEPELVWEQIASLIPKG